MQASFDPFVYMDTLKSAGVPEEQALVHAPTLRDLLDSELTTRQDVVDIEHTIENAELVLITKSKRSEMFSWQYLSSCEVRPWTGEPPPRPRSLKMGAGMLVGQAAFLGILAELL